MRNPVIDDEKAQEWERIKGFVSGANKPSKHPLVQEMERMKAKSPEHFDEGGMAVDPNVPGGTIPTPQPAPAPAIDPTEAAVTKATGGITPETISQLFDKLSGNYAKGQIGAGIAGIGDAIASVGGSNPGHMKATEDALQNRFEAGMKVPEQMMNVGKEQFGIKQTLEEQDPNSKLSKYAQEAYGPLLAKIGIDGSHASAKLIGDLAGKTIDQLKNEAQAKEARAIHEQTGELTKSQQDINRLVAEGNIKNQEAERDIREKGQQAEAAKTLENKGLFKSLIDMVPGTAGHEANKFLRNQMTGQGEAAIPDGRIEVISPTGQIGHIPKEQLKDALNKGYKLQ